MKYILGTLACNAESCVCLPSSHPPSLRHPSLASIHSRYSPFPGGSLPHIIESSKTIKLRRPCSGTVQPHPYCGGPEFPNKVYANLIRFDPCSLDVPDPTPAVLVRPLNSFYTLCGHPETKSGAPAAVMGAKSKGVLSDASLIWVVARLRTKPGYEVCPFDSFMNLLNKL